MEGSDSFLNVCVIKEHIETGVWPGNEGTGWDSVHCLGAIGFES